jgi:hypothetical protein
MSSQEKIVLGIDPGTATTGYGIIAKRKGSGVVKAVKYTGFINQAHTKEYKIVGAQCILCPINLATCHGMSNPGFSSSSGVTKVA